MNTPVIINNGVAVTTSMAIAAGTENDHASVIKLIRTYQCDLEEFGRVGFQIDPFETAGGTQKREVAILNEQQATLLLTYMRNSGIVRSFKKRLVKAFYELANRAKNPLEVLNDPAAMRSLLLNYTEKVLELESKVDELKPKAGVAERISEAKGLFCIRDAAKILGKSQNEFVRWLMMNNWLFRNNGSGRLMGYAPKVKQGYLEHKVTVVQMLDGEDKNSAQVMITGKGLYRLADIFNVEAELDY